MEENYLIKTYAENGLMIRLSRNGDLESIKTVMLTVLEDLSPTLAKWYHDRPEVINEQFLSSGKRVFYTIENLDGKVVGSAGLIQKSEDVGELTIVYFMEECRGLGLGKAVIKNLIDEAKKLEFKSVYLTTREELNAAINLYRKLGFVDAKIQRFPDSEKAISLELIF